jgi:hypothetical protein
MAERKPTENARGISDAELEEFEDFAREQEANTSPYHVQQCLAAAQVLLLIELIRGGRGIKPPKPPEPEKPAPPPPAKPAKSFKKARG